MRGSRQLNDRNKIEKRKTKKPKPQAGVCIRRGGSAGGTLVCGGSTDGDGEGMTSKIVSAFASASVCVAAVPSVVCEEPDSATTGIDASISAIVLDTRQYSRRMDWCSAATCKCSKRQYTHVRLVPSLLPSSTWCRTTKMTTGADLAHLVCRILSQHPRARAVRWHHTQPHRVGMTVRWSQTRYVQHFCTDALHAIIYAPCQTSAGARRHVAAVPKHPIRVGYV